MDEILLAIVVMHYVHVHLKCVTSVCGLDSHSW